MVHFHHTGLAGVFVFDHESRHKIWKRNTEILDKTTWCSILPYKLSFQKIKNYGLDLDFSNHHKKQFGITCGVVIALLGFT